jgi:hypothetical protein
LSLASLIKLVADKQAEKQLEKQAGVGEGIVKGVVAVDAYSHGVQF